LVGITFHLPIDYRARTYSMPVWSGHVRAALCAGTSTCDQNVIQYVI